MTPNGIRAREIAARRFLPKESESTGCNHVHDGEPYVTYCHQCVREIVSSATQEATKAERERAKLASDIWAAWREDHYLYPSDPFYMPLVLAMDALAGETPERSAREAHEIFEHAKKLWIELSTPTPPQEGDSK